MIYSGVDGSCLLQVTAVGLEYRSTEREPTCKTIQVLRNGIELGDHSAVNLIDG